MNTLVLFRLHAIYFLLGYLCGMWQSSYVFADITQTQWHVIWPYVWLILWPVCLLYLGAMWIGYWCFVVLCFAVMFAIGWYGMEFARNWFRS